MDCGKAATEKNKMVLDAIFQGKSFTIIHIYAYVSISYLNIY